MWLLNNATPFAAANSWVRDENGAEVWLVAVRGSFLIDASGKQVLDEQQTEVKYFPEFRGDPASSSLLHECDLEHKKRCTDVIVDGHAVAPGGRPGTCVDVRLKLAFIDKTLRVYGDRVIKNSLMGVRPTKPKPFTKMPIIYERSFGGTDLQDENPKCHAWVPENPVGVGFSTQKKHIIGTPAPNIEDPKSPYDHIKRGKPVGFGPIARHWMPRIKLAGTYDEKWEETRSPLLPVDFDERFYQCAPQDQQVDGFLKGGEVVELYNMTPDGFLSFHLPRVKLSLRTYFYDGTFANHRAAMHTLILQPDQRRFQMIWHSHLPCHQKVNKLQQTKISLKTWFRVPKGELASGVWIGE
jgi:hypothetical protein